MSVLSYKGFKQIADHSIRVYCWLHLKRSSVHIAAALRATFWPKWPTVVNRTLVLEERSLCYVYKIQQNADAV